MTEAEERRSVGLRRRVRRTLRSAPMKALAAVGAATGLSAHVDREISRATAGCLFEHVSEVRPCEVAIVPGAYVFPDGTPSDMLADRLAAALALWRDEKAARVLVSGGPDEVAGMRAWLERRGVTAVDSDPGGLRTWATMRRAAAAGIGRAVICTQRFHLPRSVYLARAAGIEAVGLVCDARRYVAERANISREACARLRAWMDVAWLKRRR